MKCRLWAAFALLALSAQAALAHGSDPAQVALPAQAPMLLADDQEGTPLTGKERQKACTEEWRRFSAVEKTAQGPSWPQFYSRCIKRLKAKAG